MISMISKCKNKIKQTPLAYLMPKAERSKARFLSLPSLVQWTKNMWTLLEKIPATLEKRSKEQQKTHHLFGWLLEF